MHLWRRALVTGASAGIGAAMVEELIAHGVPTVVVARRRDRLEELARRSPLVELLDADLETPGGCALVRDRLTNIASPVELLVNNAGFGIAGNVWEVPADRAVGMIDLNIRALTELTHAALGPMRAANRGWILQVSSVASFQPGPGAAIYSATKAFVTSFSEALHEELRGSNVVVTALCPGFTRTEFHQVSQANAATTTNVPDFAWMSATNVARSGLAAAAAGRAIDVPGALYKTIGSVSNALPRRVMRRLTGVLASKV